MTRALLWVAALGLASCGYVHDRAMDLADCFKVNAGVGVGLALDLKLTDYVSPGVGIASYTWNAGWDDRRVHGVWIESDVINTPRIAYEVLFTDYDDSPNSGGDTESLVLDLALSSLNLPNERWLVVGREVSVEFFSLFNFENADDRQIRTTITGRLVDPAEEARIVDKDVWQRGFVEIGVTAGLVHARAGFNPLQFVDFLLGWFSLDVAGDDRVRGAKVRLRERKSDPRIR